MTCKDCIHYEVCIDTCADDNWNDEAPKEIKEMFSPKGCEYFKNKADFVEVIRCPECIYCDNMKCTELKDNSGHPLDVAIFDYCSQGVRKQKKDFKE